MEDDANKFLVFLEIQNFNKLLKEKSKTILGDRKSAYYLSILVLYKNLSENTLLKLLFEPQIHLTREQTMKLAKQ